MKERNLGYQLWYSSDNDRDVFYNPINEADIKKIYHAVDKVAVCVEDDRKYLLGGGLIEFLFSPSELLEPNSLKIISSTEFNLKNSLEEIMELSEVSLPFVAERVINNLNTQ